MQVKGTTEVNYKHGSGQNVVCSLHSRHELIPALPLSK